MWRGCPLWIRVQAASALAAFDLDVAHQEQIIKAGVISPLVALLKSGSGAAQAFAAQATANAAAFSREAQNAIAKTGSIPLLLALLGTGKAQKPAASGPSFARVLDAQQCAHTADDRVPMVTRCRQVRSPSLPMTIG